VVIASSESGQYLSVHEFVTMAFLSLDICRFNLKSQYKPGSLKKVQGTSEDVVSDAKSSTRSFPLHKHYPSPQN
jgi:hypothetical protein